MVAAAVSVLANLDAVCAAARRRVYKAIALRIAKALHKPGMPSPTRSVGQKFKRKT